MTIKQGSLIGLLPAIAAMLASPAAGRSPTMRWERQIDGTGSWHDEGLAVAVGPDGHVVSAANSYFSGKDYKDILTTKFDGESGVVLWQRRSHTTTNRSDGTRLWENSYNPEGRAEVRALALDSAGNAVVTGTRIPNGEDDQFFTRKIDGGSGGSVWTEFFDPAGSAPGFSSESHAFAVATDPDDNPVVAGYSIFPATDSGSDIAIVKYAAADGAELFVRRVPYGVDSDSPGGRHSLAVGPGHIIVVGRASTRHEGYDLHVFRFAEDAAPSAETLPAGDLQGTTATLHGSINPNGSRTSVRFEYGLSPTNLNQGTSTLSLGDGYNPVGHAGAIGGLTPGTRHYYRARAQSPASITSGARSPISPKGSASR
jgi:hypothetical protein